MWVPWSPVRVENVFFLPTLNRIVSLFRVREQIFKTEFDRRIGVLWWLSGTMYRRQNISIQSAYYHIKLESLFVSPSGETAALNV